ncbi:hypothetical protein Ciccas_002253 [Cichlidogyrus casuarinus]|uniref:Riboflavin transporter n=1 Tax=Cichlidogyrus casuarinus TaxID=1844966 RepID=A0ABD2QHS4_9PLAT
MCTCLSMLAGPVVAFFGLLLQSKKCRGMMEGMELRIEIAWNFLIFCSSLSSFHIIYLASCSPHLPSLGGFGPYLSIFSWILMHSCFTAIRTWMAVYLIDNRFGYKALRQAGIATQIGAAFGAITAYLLVVQFELFISAPPCN